MFWRWKFHSISFCETMPKNMCSFHHCCFNVYRSTITCKFQVVSSGSSSHVISSMTLLRWPLSVILPKAKASAGAGGSEAEKENTNGLKRSYLRWEVEKENLHFDFFWKYEVKMDGISYTKHIILKNSLFSLRSCMKLMAWSLTAPERRWVSTY